MTLGLIGLSGCTDDETSPRPSVTTTPSAAIEATPTATATPPVAPKAEPTPKSAEAFVRYFWDVYNYSYRTLDSSKLEAISNRDCLFCKDTIKAVQKLASAQQIIEGSEIKVNVAVAPPTKPSAGLIVVTIIDETPGRIVAADGSYIRRTAGVRNMKSEIALDWIDERWIVRDLANDEKTGKKW
jgi:uncharacterized protein DUF6318